MVIYYGNTDTPHGRMSMTADPRRDNSGERVFIGWRMLGKPNDVCGRRLCVMRFRSCAANSDHYALPAAVRPDSAHFGMRPAGQSGGAEAARSAVCGYHLRRFHDVGVLVPCN